jgi:exonuclease III
LEIGYSGYKKNNEFHTQNVFLECWRDVHRGMDKTNDPIFFKSIEKYDSVFLAETHLGYNSTIKNIGPFHYHPILVCRSVTRANNRYVGGLAILRKPHVKYHVKILKNSNPDYQWIKLDKNFFGFQKDILICVLYYPPITSSYSKKLNLNLFDYIEKDIISLCKNSDIIVCGDFNARTGIQDVYIIQDDSKCLPLFDTYPH